jgi:glycolate oxidase FAD binding subunit
LNSICNWQSAIKNLMTPDALLEAAGLVGRAAARSAGEQDRIEDVEPRFVVEPDSPDTLAALLSWASKERLSAVIRGNGTKSGWGRRPTAVDLIVSTRRLNRVLSHQHGDLTATIEAGATLTTVAGELSRHGQWLPLSTSFADATIGGTVAANDSGPLRHRHGTPRDLLIGVHLALADGNLVKAGGNVVKNVAGYDLGKLMSGSFGGLAAIVSATFKLAPRPAASSTVVAVFRNREAFVEAAAVIGSSQLEPAVFDLHISSENAGLKPRATTETSHRLLIQFASAPAAVEAQIDAARRLMTDGEVDILSGARESELWANHGQQVWSERGAVLRLSWLPAALPDVLAVVDEIKQLGAASVELVGRTSVGAGLIRVHAEVPIQVAAIERLRKKPGVLGNVVVLRGAAAVKEQTDVWGLSSDVRTLLGGLKQALDPAGILGAGRGPVGQFPAAVATKPHP